MEKISSQIDLEWLEFSHPPVYKIHEQRLVIGLPNGRISLLSEFLKLLSTPVFVLYVLHTSRGEGAEGRYQSPLLPVNDALAFLDRYSLFLSADSRFDLWFHSPDENVTIVWDRHNLLFIYGYSDTHLEMLGVNGFNLGNPQMNFIHMHHYWGELDSAAKELLTESPWSFSELKEADIQR